MEITKVVLLLIIGNIFMSIAWYGHLRDLSDKPWFVAAVMSWLVAFLEYCFQVPANRLGYAAGLRLEQLKVIQEAITLLVFIPFSMLYMKEKPSLDYLYAILCIMGAVFFIFRRKLLGLA